MKKFAVCGLFLGAGILFAACSKQSSSPPSASDYSSSTTPAPTTQPAASPMTTPTQTPGNSPAPAQSLEQADMNENAQINNLDKQSSTVDQSLNDKSIDIN